MFLLIRSWKEGASQFPFDVLSKDVHRNDVQRTTLAWRGTSDPFYRQTRNSSRLNLHANWRQLIALQICTQLNRTIYSDLGSTVSDKCRSNVIVIAVNAMLAARCIIATHRLTADNRCYVYNSSRGLSTIDISCSTSVIRHASPPEWQHEWP